MSVSPVAAANTAQTPAPIPAEQGSLIDSDFQTFLVMLTTQMQNQDPLNPIESSDYAVQLATFSGVEQQVQTNDLLENLADQMGLMSMSELSGWVGMEARAAAPAWFDGDPITLAPDPAPAADRTVLAVYNDAGTEVSRKEISVLSDQIQWLGLREDGQEFPDGTYSFRLESYANGELIANDQVDVYATIVEARAENGNTTLVLEGGGRIAAGDVTAIRQPQAL